MNDEQSIGVQHREGTSALAYALVFVALLVLLALTVAADQLQLGIWNTAISIGIAFAKAGLIVTFFMHLRGSPLLIKTAAGTGVVWLSIAMGLTLTDDLTRGWHDPQPTIEASIAESVISDRRVPGPSVERPRLIAEPSGIEEVSPPD